MKRISSFQHPADDLICPFALHSKIRINISQPVWGPSAHLGDAVDIRGDAGPLQPVDARELAGFHGGDPVHVVRRSLAGTLCKKCDFDLNDPK